MYSKRKGSRAVSHGLATTGNKIYCTLWIREAVMPNCSEKLDNLLQNHAKHVSLSPAP